LLRVAAWLLRYIRILKTKKEDREELSSPVLEASEIEGAERRWVRQVQQEKFWHVIKGLQANRTCPVGSLKSLMPFLDSEGFLGVSGRLQSTDLPSIPDSEPEPPSYLDNQESSFERVTRSRCERHSCGHPVEILDHSWQGGNQKFGKRLSGSIH
jgi:hypothetical protein